MTRDDGTQLVEEVENDIGIKADETDKMLAKIKVKDAHARILTYSEASTTSLRSRQGHPGEARLAGRRYVEPNVNAYKASLSGMNAAVLQGWTLLLPLTLQAPPVLNPIPEESTIPRSKRSCGRAVSKIIAEIKQEMAAKVLTALSVFRANSGDR